MYNKKLKYLKETHDNLVKLLPSNKSPENPKECPALVQFYRAITIEKDIFTNKLSEWRMASVCNAVFNVTPNELGWEHIYSCEDEYCFDPDAPSIHGVDAIGVGPTGWEIEYDFKDIDCWMLQDRWEGMLERPNYSHISSALAESMEKIIIDAAKEQNVKLPEMSQERSIV